MDLFLSPMWLARAPSQALPRVPPVRGLCFPPAPAPHWAHSFSCLFPPPSGAATVSFPGEIPTLPGPFPQTALERFPRVRPPHPSCSSETFLSPFPSGCPSSPPSLGQSPPPPLGELGGQHPCPAPQASSPAPRGASLTWEARSEPARSIMNRRPCRTSCRTLLTRLRWRTATWSTAWEREDVWLAAVGSWVLCRFPFISSCMIWVGGTGEGGHSWGPVGMLPRPASERLGRGPGRGGSAPCVLRGLGGQGLSVNWEAGCLVSPQRRRGWGRVIQDSLCLPQPQP